jgi:hypothetical protein
MSALVVSIGGAIYLLRHGHSPVDFRVFRGEPADLRNVRGIIGGTVALHGRGIIQLGLLLLIRNADSPSCFFDLWICARARPHVRRVHPHRVLDLALQSPRIHLTRRSNVQPRKRLHCKITKTRRRKCDVF